MNLAAARLRGIFRGSRRIPLRLSLWTLTVLCFLIVAAVRMGSNEPAPRFALGRDLSSLEPIQLQPLRQLSDRFTGRKYVLLTFDDGPYGKGVDEKIIKILKLHQAHAIFFLVCDHLNATTLHVPQEILESGSLIGNHSYDHAHLGNMRPTDLQHEIEGCSTRLASVTGQRPEYFRPPFGQSSPQVRASVMAAGMEQMLWDANSQDSWQTRPAQILHWSLEQTDNYSILLMHDRPTTALVLNSVLTNLEQEGFAFVLPAQTPPHTASREIEPHGN